ncbi:MAG: NADH-quinone oxidoreductase subunit A [Phycisphaerae bacterium]
MTPTLLLAQVSAVGESPAEMMQALLLFVAGGMAMVLVALGLGALVRRRYSHPVKSESYECGEEPFHGSWVQYDLRFYIVALVFIVFEVEVVLFYPWAVVFQRAGFAGLVDMLIFFAILVVGFVYLWRFGYLEWVRSTAGQRK